MNQRRRKLWKAWIIGSLAWGAAWAMAFQIFKVLGEPLRSVVSLVAFIPPLFVLLVAYVWCALARALSRPNSN